MVISTESAASVLIPSETVSVNVTTVSESTQGAVNVVDTAASSAIAIGSCESWVHR